MKTFLASLVPMLMLSSRGYAEPNSLSPLASAPKAVAVKLPLFGAIDRSVVAARTLDWTCTTTERIGPGGDGVEADDSEPMRVPHSRHDKRREMQGEKCRFGR
jgi:hypothetical protein